MTKMTAIKRNERLHPSLEFWTAPTCVFILVQKVKKSLTDRRKRRGNDVIKKRVEVKAQIPRGKVT